MDDSLQDMLATVLGAGNAVVHASAVLDFDQTQITSEMYDPNKQGPVPVQQATSKETYSGAGASQAAGVGASNVPVAATTTTTVAKSAKSGSAKTTTTVAASTGAAVTTVPSYTQVGSSQQDVVSEVTKSVNSAPGSLQQLSLAVVVNSSVKGVNTSEIKQLVSAAVGLQPSRGDSIQVAFVPFDQTAAKLAQTQLKEAASAKSKATMMSEARGGLVLLVVLGLAAYAELDIEAYPNPVPLLVVLGLLVFSMRRITKTTRVPLALPPGFEALELESGEGYAEDDEMALALTSPRTSHMAEPLGPAQAEVNQIGQMIEREPERIAEMLRAWLETGPGER